MHDPGTLVLSHSPLKKVGLPPAQEQYAEQMQVRTIVTTTYNTNRNPNLLERNLVHEVKRVGGVVDLLIPQGHQEPVCHKLNILRHGLCVHSH